MTAAAPANLPFDLAERKALAQLSFDEPAASRFATRIVGEYASGRPQFLIWCVVRHSAPRRRWEPHLDDDAALSKFRASFVKYEPLEKPKPLPLTEFLAAMRSNRPAELTIFSRVVDFLQECNVSWLLTSQSATAERTPKQLDTSFGARLATAFGQRIEYRLEEYCLVVDLVLTRFDRHALIARDATRASAPAAAAAPAAGAVARAGLASVRETDAGAADDTRSEGSPERGDVTDSDSSGSSRRPLEVVGQGDGVPVAPSPLPSPSPSPSPSRSTSEQSARQFIPIKLGRRTSESSSSRSASRGKRQ